MRARNIKPSIFKNEVLARLGPFHFILFEGLWCLADREGRLEDRPERIEAEIFPFRFQKVVTEELLRDLSKASPPFIVRYLRDGEAYIQVVNFNKHQHPHVKEGKSLIPPIPKTETTTKDGASMVQTPDQHRASPSDVLIPDVLNPESPSLTPDSTPTPAEPQKTEAPASDSLTRPIQQPQRMDANELIRNLSGSKRMNAPRPKMPVPAEPKEYKAPVTPLQCYLVGIKLLQGYDAENREWDSVYFKRYGRAAADMLKFFGDDWKAALNLSERMVKEYKSKGLDWTVDTLVRNAPAWREKSGNI